jgi:ubiquinone/menaquinone biosynthesis C-methylase UbiE
MATNLTAAVTAFNYMAASYDDLFTRSIIGQAQRKQVWRVLLDAFPSGLRILELNCGTGEDALFLSSRGRSIVACDASEEMIVIAKGRVQRETSIRDIAFRQAANEELDKLLFDEKFDGAFSNFSGLNCTEDLRPIAHSLASLVKPGGRVIICVWNPMCLVEIAWFLRRRQVRKAFRRIQGRATAAIGGQSITVFYHSARDFKRAFLPWFKLIRRKAIGVFVPPSYLEGWARENESMFTRLEQLDHMFAGWPGIRDAGDHVLLEFTRCSQ